MTSVQSPQRFFKVSPGTRIISDNPNKFNIVVRLNLCVHVMHAHTHTNYDKKLRLKVILICENAEQYTSNMKCSNDKTG